MLNRIAMGFVRRVLFTAVGLWLATAAAGATADDPKEMLERTTREMIQSLEAEREVVRQRPQRLFELVQQVLVPRVDVGRMARWVLGKHWRGATPEQQVRFTAAFETLLVRFYVSALLDDPNDIDRLLAAADHLIAFLPATRLDDNRTQVRSEVRVPDGPMVPVTFSLLLEGGDWKVYDVNVDGISVVNNYRSNFASEIQRGGLPDLIERLEQRNEELLHKADRAG